MKRNNGVAQLTMKMKRMNPEKRIQSTAEQLVVPIIESIVLVPLNSLLDTRAKNTRAN